MSSPLVSIVGCTWPTTRVVVVVVCRWCSMCGELRRRRSRRRPRPRRRHGWTTTTRVVTIRRPTDRLADRSGRTTASVRWPRVRVLFSSQLVVGRRPLPLHVSVALTRRFFVGRPAAAAARRSTIVVVVQSSAIAVLNIRLIVARTLADARVARRRPL